MDIAEIVSDPRPSGYTVEVGDVACLARGPLLRVVALVDGAAVVERVHLTIVAR